MQDRETLARYGITEEDCELGMILLDVQNPSRRWQGSDAAEEIVRLLPAGEPLVRAYRTLPGMKWAGDRAYEQIRDNRYNWFGKRSTTYRPCHSCTPAVTEPDPAADKNPQPLA